MNQRNFVSLTTDARRALHLVLLAVLTVLFSSCGGGANGMSSDSFPPPSQFIRNWNAQANDDQTAIAEFSYDDEVSHPISEYKDAPNKVLSLWCKKIGGTRLVKYHPEHRSYSLVEKLQSTESPEILLIQAANPAITADESRKMMLAAAPFGKPGNRGSTSHKGVLLEVSAIAVTSDMVVTVSPASAP